MVSAPSFGCSRVGSMGRLVCTLLAILDAFGTTLPGGRARAYRGTRR